MTRQTWARIAGFTFLFYVATVLPGAMLFEGASGGELMADRLAGIAEHAPQVRLAILLTMMGIFSALVLAVALYAITREEDPNLALLAMSCRLGEGVINVVPTLVVVGMLWLATTDSVAVDGASADALGAVMLNLQGWTMLVGATVFAVGSTIFAYLFLRARSIPVWLAWLGVVASLILVLGLPADLVGWLGGRVTMLIWLPMAVFEVTLGLWLLVKGVAPLDGSAAASEAE